MRVWRKNRKAEMAVTFSDKPEPQHLETLNDAGFRWQGDAWVPGRPGAPQGDVVLDLRRRPRGGDRQSRGPVVYLLTRPATNYYRNRTEQSPMMAVLVDQVI